MTDYVIAVLGQPPDPPPANPALITQTGQPMETRLIDTGTIAGDTGNLVWNPAGTRAGNVYTQWDGSNGLAQAIAALNGAQATVTVNGGASLTIPSGTYNLPDAYIRFVAGFGEPAEAEIQAASDAVLQGVSVIELHSVSIVYTGNGSLVSVAANTLLRIDMDDDSQIVVSGGGTGPVVSVLGTLVSFCSTGVWGADSLQIGSTGVADLILMNVSQLQANAISGSAGGQAAIAWDASSSQGVSQTQGAGPTITFAPADIGNTASGTGNTGTGTGTVTVSTSAPITPRLSGTLKVDGRATGTISGAGTVTAQLVRDPGGTPVNIGSPMSLVLAAAGQFSLNPVTYDTPSVAAHTYELKVTASAGTLAVAATSAQIAVGEQP